MMLLEAIPPVEFCVTKPFTTNYKKLKPDGRFANVFLT
jgi:hypothetical protein